MKDSETISKRYEAVRACAIGATSGCATRSQGYALLVRHGIPGWLMGWRDAAGIPSSREGRVDEIGDALHNTPDMSAITCILTTMLLGHTGKAVSR